jgi:hypothetical protein
MRQRLKISLSLLISLILCGGFAVFSFTRLFNIVETTFFQRRIVEQREAQLERIAEKVADYHNRNIDYFEPLTEAQYTWNTFRPSNQLAREDIEDLELAVGGLLDLHPQIQMIRFLGADGESIHYSTRSEDIDSSDRQRRKYLDYDSLEESVAASELLVPAGSPPKVVIDGSQQRFIYSLPVEQNGEYRGVALFYVYSRDLLEYLLRSLTLDLGDLTLIGQRGIVFHSPRRNPLSVQSKLIEIWDSGAFRREVYQESVTFEVSSAGQEQQGAANEPGGEQTEEKPLQIEQYNLLSLNTSEYGVLSLLIPYSVFQLQPIMKGVVLAAIFLTVFLILYLLFNLRQDPVLVLSQRIKRLQLDILREFVEGRERINWSQWQKKLEVNRGELKSRIKRGLGRIPSPKERELDQMIDQSWDEIISLIETRVGGAQPQAPDIRHIEELLQRALEGAQLTVRAPVSGPPVVPARKGGIVVEEIGVDEVVEPGEVIPTEEAEEVAEELAEVEELEEAEAAEEAEEPAEAEEVAEAEELEEAEAAEEAEELAEVEEVAEEPAEVEELEEAEAAEEAEELAEVEEVAEAEEAEALEEAQVVAASEEAVFLEGEEQEVVEELEEVKEIVPLPPLPEEQLEELPTADAEQQEVASLSGEQGAEQPLTAPQEAVAGVEGPVEELEVAEDEAAPIETILSAGEELVMETMPGQEQARQLSQEEIEKIQQSDERNQLEKFLASNTIRTYSLQDIEAIIMEQRSSVVMEDGVYRIKDEIVAGAAEGKPSRRGLMALAAASLSEPAKSTGGLESGIGALLGDESILDLETEIGQIRERSTEIDYAALRKTKNIHFFEDGLDYDEYLKSFRGGKTETDRLRSLVELSGKLKAVNAAIFSKDNGKYELVLKVGLNDPGFEVYFTSEEPFVDMFVRTRSTVYIGENIEKIKALAKKMHPDDLKYMQAALIFPAVFRGRQSFVLLGLPVRWDLDIEDIITRLDIF